MPDEIQPVIVPITICVRESAALHKAVARELGDVDELSIAQLEELMIDYNGSAVPAPAKEA